MESQIAAALQLKYSPVAILWTDEKPEGAMQFAPGRWGCVMAAFAAAASQGKAAAFDRETYGCWGGGVGSGTRQRVREVSRRRGVLLPVPVERQ